MKITKGEDEVIRLKTLKEIANRGCNICPCCGEKESNLFYIRNGITNKGILSGLGKSYAKGFFKFKHYQIDCYSCKTCGAEWESDPYEY